MSRPDHSRWLERLPLAGPQALLCGIAVLAIPTAVRAAVSGVVTGCEFTPYLPFVLIAAILLRWWQAGAVALGAVLVLGGLFLGPIADLACFLWSAGIFLACSAGLIALAHLARGAAAAMLRRGAAGPASEIVFSLEQGEVWASWSGPGAPVRLGRQHKVARMMEDFLAQNEIGERLTRRRR